MLLPPPVPAGLAVPHLVTDPTSSHTRDLSDADAARGRVRTALKATRKEGAQAGQGADWAGAARVRRHCSDRRWGSGRGAASERARALTRTRLCPSADTGSSRVPAALVRASGLRRGRRPPPPQRPWCVPSRSISSSDGLLRILLCSLLLLARLPLQPTAEEGREAGAFALAVRPSYACSRWQASSNLCERSTGMPSSLPRYWPMPSVSPTRRRPSWPRSVPTRSLPPSLLLPSRCTTRRSIRPQTLCARRAACSCTLRKS